MYVHMYICKYVFEIHGTSTPHFKIFITNAPQMCSIPEYEKEQKDIAPIRYMKHSFKFKSFFTLLSLKVRDL